MKFSLFFAVAIAIGLLAVQSDLSAQSVKERTLGKKGTHPTSRNLHESPKGLNAVNVKVAIASPPDLTQILYENRGTDGNWESGVIDGTNDLLEKIWFAVEANTNRVNDLKSTAVDHNISRTNKGTVVGDGSSDLFDDAGNMILPEADPNGNWDIEYDDLEDELEAIRKRKCIRNGGTWVVTSSHKFCMGADIDREKSIGDTHSTGRDPYLVLPDIDGETRAADGKRDTKRKCLARGGVWLCNSFACHCLEKIDVNEKNQSQTESGRNRLIANQVESRNSVDQETMIQPVADSDEGDGDGDFGIGGRRKCIKAGGVWCITSNGKFCMMTLPLSTAMNMNNDFYPEFLDLENKNSTTSKTTGDDPIDGIKIAIEYMLVSAIQKANAVGPGPSVLFVDDRHRDLSYQETIELVALTGELALANEIKRLTSGKSFASGDIYGTAPSTVVVLSDRTESNELMALVFKDCQ